MNEYENNEIEVKDYEHYLDDEADSAGGMLINIRNYWRGFANDMYSGMDCMINDYHELTDGLEDMTDNQEIMDMAVEAGRMRTLALVSESAIGAIGNCLEAAASLFDKDAKSAEPITFKPGDHLYIRNGLKGYHGIYAGNRTVVFYSKGFDMLPTVRTIPFALFAKKGRVTVMPSEGDSRANYSPEQIVERAKSMLGEDEFRNSESFVRWCRCGS